MKVCGITRHWSRPSGALREIVHFRSASAVRRLSDQPVRRMIPTALLELDATGWDYEIRSFDGWTLKIVGGISVAYPDSHAVEIEFGGMSYISCPHEFTNARFRQATEAELGEINDRAGLEDNDLVTVVEAEPMGHLTPRVYYIVSESVVVHERTA